jgi:hypothetical protein
VGSRSEADEGPVPPEPAHGDERQIVRAFTDLHRRDQFAPAPRPVTPLRSRRRPPSEMIDIEAVDAEALDAEAVDTPPTASSTAPVAETRVANGHAVDAEAVATPAAEASTADTRASDTPAAGILDAQPTPSRHDPKPDRPAVRPAGRRQHDALRRPRASDGAGGVGRQGLAGTAERRLSDVLGLAAASGALIAPWPWLLAVAGSCLAAGAIRSVASGRRSVAVGIVDLPGRTARRMAGLLQPRSLTRLPLIAAKTVLVSFVLPAAVAATVWFIDHGLDGLLAAARLAAWQSGPRVLAAVLCLMMVAGIGETRLRRATRLRQATASWSDNAVVALASGALALAVAVVAVGPRVNGGILSGHDGLAWVPAGLRPAADGVRDELVGAELRVLRSCLTEHQGLDWSVDHTTNNVDDPDIARLAIGGDEQPRPATLVTAALAADNQLAPWVEVVEIAVGDAVMLRLDRQALHHHGVRVDPATLGPGIVSGAGVAVAGATGVDRRVALACSAGPAL